MIFLDDGKTAIVRGIIIRTNILINQRDLAIKLCLSHKAVSNEGLVPTYSLIDSGKYSIWAAGLCMWDCVEINCTVCVHGNEGTRLTQCDSLMSYS